MRSAGDGELASDDDRDHPRRRQPHLHQRQERRRGEQLVGERIDDLTERRHLLAPARQVAVEPVGERREREDGGADQLLPHAEDRCRPSNFVSSTTTSSGTRKIRVERERIAGGS